MIGSRYSADTFRIREFLSRNDLPYTWMDLEKNPEAQQLLDTFGVAPDDTPLMVSQDGEFFDILPSLKEGGLRCL